MNYDFNDSVRADLEHMRAHKRYRGTAIVLLQMAAVVAMTAWGLFA